MIIMEVDHHSRFGAGFQTSTVSHGSVTSILIGDHNLIQNQQFSLMNHNLPQCNCPNEVF